MTIHKAIRHFEWKLSNNKNTTKTDGEAYNTMVEFVEQKHKQQYNENQLFAKLYITFFGEMLKYYNATVFDKEPQKAIHQILNTPIEVLIDKFIDKHQTIEYVLQIPKEYRYEKTKYIHPSKYKDFDIKHVDKMQYQEVEENFKSMINLALNEYS